MIINRPKLSEDKQNFISKFFNQDYQLTVKDVEDNIKKYKKKYNISILINGETNAGKEYRNKIKRFIYARYVMKYWLEERTSKRESFEIGETLCSNFCNVYQDIKSKIANFLDSNGCINKSLDEDQQSKLNQLISENFKEIFDKNIQNSNITKHIPLDIVSDEIKEIQSNLKKEEVVGYYFTNESEDKGHFEILIITKNNIIKPVQWKTGVDVIKDKHSVNNTLCTVNISNIIEFDNNEFETPLPQADIVSCGALGLSYLKELLKNDAEQYKQFAKTFSFYNKDGELVHFFIPSPHVLRYSQSKFYNEILCALFNDENTKIKHNDNTGMVLCLEHILEHSIYKAKELNDTKILDENMQFLNGLPEFKKQWLKSYQESSKSRELMQDKINKHNLYLSYKTYKMCKVSEENGILFRLLNDSEDGLRNVEFMKKMFSLIPKNITPLSFFNEEDNKTINHHQISLALSYGEETYKKIDNLVERLKKHQYCKNNTEDLSYSLSVKDLLDKGEQAWKILSSAIQDKNKSYCLSLPGMLQEVLTNLTHIHARLRGFVKNPNNKNRQKELEYLLQSEFGLKALGYTGVVLGKKDLPSYNIIETALQKIYDRNYSFFSESENKVWTNKLDNPKHRKVII